MKIIQTFSQCDGDFYKTKMNSWKEKYDYNCFSDQEIGMHIIDYCKHFDQTLCYAYDNLPHKINRIDLWRYVYIFMHGGLYVDVDIAALPDIVNVDFEKYEVVLFKESPNVYEYEFFKYLLTFFFSDHPRFFQYRQSIFYATKGNRYLKLLIDKIIATDPNLLFYTEPKYTFELTGPGVFTDIMKHSTHHTIEYSESKHYIDYHSTGSWRSYFAPLIQQIIFLQYAIVFLLCMIYFMFKKNVVLK